MSDASSQEFGVRFRETKYDGYTSFSYLKAGVDYEEFALATEFGREPLYDLGLDEEQTARTIRLIDDNIIISLHDHPAIFPDDMTQVRDYIRTGRERTSYAGLAAFGHDRGVRQHDGRHGLRHQQVRLEVGRHHLRPRHAAAPTWRTRSTRRIAYSLDDICAAHGERADCDRARRWRPPRPIENEVDRIDILYGLRRPPDGHRLLRVEHPRLRAQGDEATAASPLFGRRAVERMNAFGHRHRRVPLQRPDLPGHLRGTRRKPVLITHAGARSVWNTRRMKPDCGPQGVRGDAAASSASKRRRTPRFRHDHLATRSSRSWTTSLYCVEPDGLDHVAFGPDTLYGDHVGLHKVFAANLGVADAHEGPEFNPVEYVAGLRIRRRTSTTSLAGWSSTATPTSRSSRSAEATSCGRSGRSGS